MGVYLSTPTPAEQDEWWCEKWTPLSPFGRAAAEKKAKAPPPDPEAGGGGGVAVAEDKVDALIGRALWMGETLAGYDAEARTHIETAKVQCPAAEAAPPGDERSKALAAAETATEAARDTVQLMELEGRSLVSVGWERLQERLQDYRAQCARLKARTRDLRAARIAADMIRAELVAGRSEPAEHASAESETLLAAHDTALEAEETASSVLLELESQRGTLQHAQGTLQEAQAGLDQSKRASAAALSPTALYLGIAARFDFGPARGGGRLDSLKGGAGTPPSQARCDR